MTGFMNAASCDDGGGRPPIHKTAAAGAGIRDVVCPPPQLRVPTPPGPGLRGGGAHRSPPPSPPLPPPTAPAGRPEPLGRGGERQRRGAAPPLRGAPGLRTPAGPRRPPGGFYE